MKIHSSFNLENENKHTLTVKIKAKGRGNNYRNMLLCFCLNKKNLLQRRRKKNVCDFPPYRSENIYSFFVSVSAAEAVATAISLLS